MASDDFIAGDDQLGGGIVGTDEDVLARFAAKDLEDLVETVGRDVIDHDQGRILGQKIRERQVAVRQPLVVGHAKLARQRFLLGDGATGRYRLLPSYEEIGGEDLSGPRQQSHVLDGAPPQHLHERQRRLADDRRLDGQAQQKTQVAVVFAKEDEHGLVEDVDIAIGLALRALALVVEDAAGQVPVFVAPLEHAVAEVDVLAIHEEVLVEQSDLVERLSPQEAVGAADDLDGVGLVPRQIAHVVSAQPSAVGEALAEPRDLVEGGERRGQSASRLLGVAAVRAQHPHSRGSRLRMGVHEGDGLADGLLADDGVGIEQQHILRLARPDGEVVGARKTEVVAAGDHLHLGEAGREIADGVVLGVVVHHIDLGVDAREGAAQADETLLQVVLDVVADDNDGELMGHLSLCLYKIRCVLWLSLVGGIVLHRALRRLLFGAALVVAAPLGGKDEGDGEQVDDGHVEEAHHCPEEVVEQQVEDHRYADHQHAHVAPAPQGRLAVRYEAIPHAAEAEEIERAGHGGQEHDCHRRLRQEERRAVGRRPQSLGDQSRLEDQGQQQEDRHGSETLRHEYLSCFFHILDFLFRAGHGATVRPSPGACGRGCCVPVSPRRYIPVRHPPRCRAR